MFLGCCNFTGQLGMLYECGIGNFPKGMFIWETLSWLARKHFDKFTSEISPSNVNSMKSYLTFMRRKVFLFDSFPFVDRRDLRTRENNCAMSTQQSETYPVIPVNWITFPILTAQNYLASRNGFSQLFPI